MRKYLESPIFYMGNKYKLLKQLIPLFPDKCKTFLDLFGGSCVVSMNYKGTEKTIYNEINKNIVDLVLMFKENDVEELDRYFNEKIKEYNICCTGKNFREHIELQKGYYDFRDYYNKSEKKDKRDLYLLICYSMNHLIRFNKKDEFVYCDPPYLNTEAVYNEKRAYGGWCIDDDYKLFDILEELHNKGVKWGLSNVFYNRGKSNDHLIEWCDKNNWHVYHLNRNYNPFSRGNSNNDEVYICNYSRFTDLD